MQRKMSLQQIWLEFLNKKESKKRKKCKRNKDKI